MAPSGKTNEIWSDRTSRCHPQLLLIEERREPDFFYGPSTVFRSWCKSLTARGAEIAFQSRTLPPRLPINGSNIQSSARQEVLGTNDGKPPKIAKIAALPAIREFESADVINLHYARSMTCLSHCIAGRLLRKPVAVNLYFPPGPFHALFWPLINLYLVPNGFMAKALVEYGVPASRIRQIPLPLNPEVFHPIPTLDSRKALGLGPDSFIILYHGRPATTRGFQDVISLLPGWTRRIGATVVLSVADTGDEDFSRFLLESPKAIEGHYPGSRVFVGRNDATIMYNLADLVIFPFKSAYSAMTPPLSVLEAMACGRVVACADLEPLGMREVVEIGHNGFLFEPTRNDLDRCVTQIARLTSQERQIVGRRARQTILTKYAPELAAAQLDQALTGLACRRRRVFLRRHG